MVLPRPTGSSARGVSAFVVETDSPASAFSSPEKLARQASRARTRSPGASPRRARPPRTVLGAEGTGWAMKVLDNSRLTWQPRPWHRRADATRLDARAPDRRRAHRQQAGPVGNDAVDMKLRLKHPGPSHCRRSRCARQASHSRCSRPWPEAARLRDGGLCDRRRAADPRRLRLHARDAAGRYAMRASCASTRARPRCSANIIAYAWCWPTDRPLRVPRCGKRRSVFLGGGRRPFS